jgi:hypothetical protein
MSLYLKLTKHHITNEYIATKLIQFYLKTLIHLYKNNNLCCQFIRDLSR